jgi:hypothetical protein
MNSSNCFSYSLSISLTGAPRLLLGAGFGENMFMFMFIPNEVGFLKD